MKEAFDNDMIGTDENKTKQNKTCLRKNSLLQVLFTGFSSCLLIWTHNRPMYSSGGYEVTPFSLMGGYCKGKISLITESLKNPSFVL